MEAITKLIQSLGGIIFYVFAFIVSLFQTAASGEDYKVYTSEERIAFVSEQMENFNQIVEYAFAHTDEEKRIGSVLFDAFGKKEKRIGRKLKRLPEKISRSIGMMITNG